MASSSLCHSLPSSSGVLPVVATYFVPRTAAAGFVGYRRTLPRHTRSFGCFAILTLPGGKYRTCASRRPKLFT